MTALSRLLLLVHGQPDSMATPLPGYWGRSGGARVDTVTRYYRTHCSGCTQGCEFCEGELANDVGLDAKRVIQPPIFTPEDERAIARARRWTLYLVALGFGTLAGLLGIANARWVP